LISTPILFLIFYFLENSILEEFLVLKGLTHQVAKKRGLEKQSMRRVISDRGIQYRSNKLKENILTK